MRKKFLFLFLLVITINLSLVLAVQPFGATLTPLSNQTAPADAPQSHAAIAGNVTELNIQGFTTTQSWQGYYGNVTGTIQLADASSDVLYNWSLASPQGEVYASNESSITWSSIACFDMSTDNATALEGNYGIASGDVDGVNETFSVNNGHDTFYTANTEFLTGTCPSTKIFDNTGTGVDNHFEEVMLTDGSYSTQVVWTALLDQDVLGFDQATHDFEMLVLENGHGADTATTNYYFYVELE